MPLTHSIRTMRKALRAFSLMMSLIFVHALVVPDLWVIQDGIEKHRQQSKITLTGSPEQQMNQALNKLQTLATDKHQSVRKRLEEESGWLDQMLSLFGLSQLNLADTEQLGELRLLLEEQHLTATERFEVTRQELVQKHMPPSIIQRHQQRIDEYQAHYQRTLSFLERAGTAEDLRAQGAALQQLDAAMADQKLKRKHQTVNPQQLPWGSHAGRELRKPAQTRSELEQLTGIAPLHTGVALAANTVPEGLLGEVGGPTADDS